MDTLRWLNDLEVNPIAQYMLSFSTQEINPLNMSGVYIYIYTCVCLYMYLWAFQMALMVRNTSANAGDVRDAGSIPVSDRSPEEGMDNMILAWRIPWTEEPGGLQSLGSQRVRHNWASEQRYMYLYIYSAFQDLNYLPKKQARKGKKN